MRRDAREAVFVLLYRDLFTEEKDDDFKNKIYKEHKLNSQDAAFADELYLKVLQNRDHLLGLIEEMSVGFKLNRIFPTDKCALLIGLCEMNYFDDIPDIVSIDEAVSLSKKYSAEKSFNFVNGILAEYKKKSEAAK